MLFNNIINFEVGFQDFSDHLPLCCTLKCKCYTNDTKDTNLKTAYHYKWDETLKQTFTEKFTDLYTVFSQSLSETNVVCKLNDFINVFKQAGSCMKKLRCGDGQKFKSSSTQPKWWD